MSRTGKGGWMRTIRRGERGAAAAELHAARRRLGRKVTGGAPLALREITKLHGSGRALVGKTIVIDPGHGGPDLGATVPEGLLRWTEADLAFDLALRLEGRLGAAGMRVYLTRGPSPEHELTDRERVQLANDLGADLLISSHIERRANP